MTLDENHTRDKMRLAINFEVEWAKDIADSSGPILKS